MEASLHLHDGMCGGMGSVCFLFFFAGALLLQSKGWQANIFFTGGAMESLWCGQND